MSAVLSLESKRPIWQTIVILTLGFWLSSSLVLDWVIIPSLYVAGMMTQAGFATAGYLLFWNFNRLELLAVAIVMTGVLVLNRTHPFSNNWLRSALVAMLLLAICLVDTYFLTPQMSAVGLQLNLFASTTEMPAVMGQMHLTYWGLEAMKLIAGVTLLRWCYRQVA
jgi:hypothetical protein